MQYRTVRIIAFIVDGAEVRKILEHTGVDARAPRIAPARGPPLWLAPVFRIPLLLAMGNLCRTAWPADTTGLALVVAIGVVMTTRAQQKET